MTTIRIKNCKLNIRKELTFHAGIKNTKTENYFDLINNGGEKVSSFPTSVSSEGNLSKIVLDFTPLADNKAAFLFGVDGCYNVSATSSNNKVGCIDGAIGGVKDLLLGTVNSRHTVEIGADYLKVGAEERQPTESVGTRYAHTRLYLFAKAANNTDAPTSYVPVNSIIYHNIKLYNSDGLLYADIYPCEKNGVVGLYDTVRKVFLTNNGSDDDAFEFVD